MTATDVHATDATVQRDGAVTSAAHIFIHMTVLSDEAV